MLLPVLLLLDVPVLAAIGLGQAIALPIAGLASVANIAAGIMDLWLAAGLAVTLTLGIAIGTPIAHALPQRLLRRLLGSVVALAGLAMLLRTAARLLRVHQQCLSPTCSIVTPHYQHFTMRQSALSALCDLIQRNAAIAIHDLRLLAEPSQLPARIRAAIA